MVFDVQNVILLLLSLCLAEAECAFPLNRIFPSEVKEEEEETLVLLLMNLWGRAANKMERHYVLQRKVLVHACFHTKQIIRKIGIGNKIQTLD